MKISEIGIWSCARLSSKRCPQKMTRPFADTTLTDVFLRKLSAIKSDVNVFFAGYDGVFKEKCAAHNVPFVQRSEESANVDEPAAKIYEFLTTQPYEYMLQVNACIPFLKTKTILEYVNKCAADPRPSFAVIKKNNYFVELDGKPLNWSKDITTINTKKVSPVYEFAHVFYFFKKEYFVKTGWYWDWNDVQYIEIPAGLEIFDIDTEDEFDIAQALWREKGHLVK